MKAVYYFWMIICFVDECYSSLAYIVLALMDGKHSLLN